MTDQTKQKIEEWEKKFWQMTDDKGVGSDVRYAQACRDFIRQEKAASREEGHSAALDEAIGVVERANKWGQGDGGANLASKQEILSALRSLKGRGDQKGLNAKE